MQPSLLATKLRVPPLARHALRRDRLVDALEQGITGYRLALVAAPAGYGKTTLLAQWAHATDLAVAWLSLGEEDDDVERFFRYLLRAWEDAQPGVMDSPLGVLLGSMMPDSKAVLSAFINTADDAPRDTVFVLDDYHLIEEPAIHDALTFLLDHLPQTLHFVLACRGEPPLPLARYRARRQLLELGPQDLNFSADETEAFLNENMGLELAEDDTRRLQGELEGWVAGLQLAALSLQQRRDEGRRPLISGRHRFIADYFGEDVLAQLPENTRRFLLQTAILERLCGPLCDAVTGGEGGQAMLETLERENLFLAPLDESREWFRYHRLFADFLREEGKRRLSGELAALHRRAAWWYLEHDLPEPAFQHALAGDDAELVIRIIERYLNIMLNSGELKIVMRWLDSLPAAWFSAHPVLDLARAGTLAYTGAFDAGLRSIDDVEQRLTLVEGEDARWQLAMVKAVRCFMACVQNDVAQAEVLAYQALPDLREESLSFRASIYHALGDSYRRNGRWEEAKACYLKVPRVIDVPGFHLQAVIQSAHVFGALADLELLQGRLRNAAGYWKKALAAIQEQESWGRIELPVIGWVYIRMAEILYEWNELEEAATQLARGLERAKLGGDPQTLIAGYLLAGRLKLTAGDLEAAGERLEHARPLIENAPFPDWVSRFERFQLEFWLAQDRLRAAVDWADEAVHGEDSRLQDRRPTTRLSSTAAVTTNEETQLAIARALIVKGDGPSIERVLALLERLLEAAEAEGRMAVLVEALALQALAHWRRNEEASAMTSLEHALRLAEPEGYLRLFVDLGLPMARLLQEARSRDVLPEYVQALLEAFGQGPALATTEYEMLPEPLTPREQDVLELLAAGLTNREIAEELVVSPETVKKHAGNIYGKLGAGNRTEAVARARELDLLN